MITYFFEGNPMAGTAGIIERSREGYHVSIGNEYTGQEEMNGDFDSIVKAYEFMKANHMWFADYDRRF